MTGIGRLPDGLTLPPLLLRALEEAHQEPPRAYHHFGHVREVLAHYRDVDEGPGWERPREMFLAVLYHDAIYRPGSGDNEAKSAALARESIARWIPDEGIDEEQVARAILLTADHGTLRPQDVTRDEAHFLDCDMAILGADRARFDAYQREIAQEYDHIPKAAFLEGRRAFLASVLSRPRIFLSEMFHTRLNAAARENLARALTPPGARSDASPPSTSE